MRSPHYSPDRPNAPASYEGYSVDLLAEVASLLGFNFTLHIVPDDSYGYFDRDKQKWTGLIGELVEQVSYVNYQHIWY